MAKAQASEEQERIAALERYAQLDTPPDARLDVITEIARRLFSVPIAMVSLIDRDRVWFKSCAGLDLRELPRQGSLCAISLQGSEVLVILDTTRDERAAKGPHVVGAPHLRFYAGAPLRDKGGNQIGVLSILDYAPRKEFVEAEQGRLAELASLAMQVIELRQKEATLQQRESALRAIVETTSRETGLTFLQTLVRELSRALGMERAQVAMLEPRRPGIVRTLAACVKGEIIPDFEYAVAGGPCADMTRNEIWVIPDGVGEKFPGAPVLAEMGIRSYVGVPVLDPAGVPQGVVALLHTSPLEGPDLPEPFLRLLGARVAGEVERLRQEEQRLDLERRLLDTHRRESVGILAGGIAHEFNNLLVAILGNAGLARRNVAADSATDRQLSQIEVASRRAADLAAQLLDFAGRPRGEPAPVELGALVAAAAPVLRAAVRGNAQIQVSSSPAPVRLLGDAGRLREALLALVTNAAESMGEKAGTIRLGAECLQASREMLAECIGGGALPEGPYGCIEVTDDGPGIAAVDLPHIFDPFFSRKKMGRGLGLSSVLGVVRFHGGVIHLQSTPGAGTVIRLLLPMSAESGDDAAGGETRRATVLVVDDEESVRSVVREMLEALGCEVLWAASAASGLDLLAHSQNTIDLVLLDETMPGGRGSEFLPAYRAANPDARIVLMSGNLPEGTLARIGLDTSRWLAKPFALADLRRLLRF